MKKWSSLLAKDALSEQLTEQLTKQLAQHPAKSNHAQTLENLSAPSASKRDVASKKRIVKEIRPLIPSDLAAELLEELDEISEDIGWKKTPRGKYVVTINDWLQPFHSKIREDDRFENLFVGGHSKHQVVYVTGSAKQQADLDGLIELLEKNNPPYKIMVNVSLTSQ